MNSQFQLFPESASTAAVQVDRLFFFLLLLSAALTALVAGLIIFFAVKYRRSAVVNREQQPASIRMEISWMVLSFPILMAIFVWGANVCFFLFRPPAEAIPITVVAKQWMWKFQHPDGRREIDTLHVPVHRPVRLTMVSQDVIHSFFIPAFRIKQDVLPGRYTSVWFEPTQVGEFRLYCAEYCGTYHSRMVGRILVQSANDHAAWLSGRGAADEPPQITGERLFEQFQCGSCHRPRGGLAPRGPPLEGVFQKPVPLATGETVVADEMYLRESILRPAAKVVAGYQPIMPAYEGQINEEGVMQLIAYLKSLSTTPEATTP